MATLVNVHLHSRARPDVITINADQIVWMERKESTNSSWTNVYFTGDRSVMIEETPDDLLATVEGLQRRPHI